MLVSKAVLPSQNKQVEDVRLNDGMEGGVTFGGKEPQGVKLYCGDHWTWLWCGTKGHLAAAFGPLTERGRETDLALGKTLKLRKPFSVGHSVQAVLLV